MFLFFIAFHYKFHCLFHSQFNLLIEIMVISSLILKLFQALIFKLLNTFQLNYHIQELLQITQQFLYYHQSTWNLLHQQGHNLISFYPTFLVSYIHLLKYQIKIVRLLHKLFNCHSIIYTLKYRVIYLHCNYRKDQTFKRVIYFLQNLALQAQKNL